mmetsp:Transcript_112837/g.319130  ORF Transcript_112837/g.319130 Transcript_112837/m.319130 type:complete len:241 (+) Transcript_112837:83-805(+)
MGSTAYVHGTVRDVIMRECQLRELHAAKLTTNVDVYGTPRLTYRPILGVSGTLQATPNPCMERDRQKPDLEATTNSATGPGSCTHALVHLPRIGVGGPWRQQVQPEDSVPFNSAEARSSRSHPVARTNRSSEVDLNWGFPPHQVHHHDFGWTLPGAKPEAAIFSPRRLRGIGLRYSDDIAPFLKHGRVPLREPSPHGRSPRDNRQAAAPGKASQQTSTAQFSTAAPPDYCAEDQCAGSRW